MLISPAQRLLQVEEYYFSRKLAEIRRRSSEGEDIINLGIGNPDMTPSDETIKELIRSAVAPGGHGYQPYKGIPALRKAFADWYLDTYGVTLNPESEILPLMGSKEGIMHISMAFLNPGDRVLVPNPGYPTYTSITRLVGAEVLPYALRAENHWLPDLEALENQGLEGVKLMWVNYPHMPTGALAPDAFFEKLIAFARRNQILLCSDNPYSLVLNPAPQSLLGYEGAKEVAIELNSLSKSHNMAGWRVGMVGGAKEYIDPILQIKSNMDSGMFLPMQEAAVKALSNSYAWHQSRNDEYRERRKIAWQLLDKLGCVYESNQSGMFVWARIPDTESNGEALSEKLLNQRGVFITPGFIFGDEGEKYIRISLCAPLNRMQEALDRVETLQQIPQP